MGFRIGYDRRPGRTIASHSPKAIAMRGVVVAPFDYTAMIWAFMLGYALFGELPSAFVFVGAAIVVACGLFVIWRERNFEVERLRSIETAGE